MVSKTHRTGSEQGYLWLSWSSPATFTRCFARWTNIVGLVFALVLSIAAPVPAATGTAAKESRIISLAPSITETLFALDAAESLVGVTRFCDFPPAASSLTKIGGLVDPNLEKTLSLTPTLVIGLPEHKNFLETIQSFGIETLVVRQYTFAEVLESIRAIGGRIGQKRQSVNLINDIRTRIAELQKQRDLSVQPSVLVTVGGHVRRGSLDAVYAAAPGTLYDELIRMAGGRNVYTGSIIYAQLSAEALLSLDPDVIIDLVPLGENTGEDVAALELETRAAWNTLSSLSAVKHNRIYIFSQDYAVTPGPRIANTFALFVRALHPANFDDVQNK